MKKTCMKSTDRAHGVERNRAPRARSLSLYRAVVLCLAALSAAGCRSLFEVERDSARFEPNRGRYVTGADATDDWTTAREETSSEYGRFRAAKRAGTYDDECVTTRGAENSDSPTWNQRVKSFFTPPLFGEKSASSSDEFDERERSAYDYNELQGNRDFERDYSQQKTKKGFWSNLFERSGSNSEVQPEVVDDDDLIVKRQGGATAAYSKPRETPKSSAPLRVKSTPDRSVKALSIFGKRSGRVPTDYRAQRIASFSTNDFMPPVSLIRVYYSTTSVAVDPRARTTRDVPVRREVASIPNSNRDQKSAPRVEETATPRQGGYRSRSYAPVDVDGSRDELPASPKREGASRFGSTQRGGASLSPIYRNDAQVAQGMKRSQTLGATRPISSEVSRRMDGDSGVAQVAYARPVDLQPSRASTPSARLPETDSLFGWSDDGKILLASFTSPRARRGKRTDKSTAVDVDFAFKNALGSQSTFAWFDSSDAPTDDEATEFVASKPAVEPELSSTDDVDASESEWKESTFDMERFGRAAAHANESLPIETSSPSKLEQPYAQVSDSADEAANFLSYEEELDDVVDQAFAISSAVADESATEAELKDASERIEDVSLSKIANDTSALSTLDDVATLEVDDAAPSTLASSPLGAKETPEVARLKTTKPETISARKAESVAVPLTEEEIAWVEQIKRAINSLLKEREEHKRLGDDSRVCDARLRLLYLVIGEYDRSIREIQDDDDPLKTFWEKECRGLETLLQNQLEEIDPTFVAERLRSGLDSFSGLCNLQIRKALLATAPACFGLFEERIAPYASGDMVRVYAELDYVASVESSPGYEINVECRWRILDRSGAVIVPFETQHCANYSETRLRDIVLNVSVPLPDDLAPGEYALELEVVDQNSSTRSAAFKRLNFVVANAEVE